MDTNIWECLNSYCYDKMDGSTSDDDDDRCYLESDSDDDICECVYEEGEGYTPDKNMSEVYPRPDDIIIDVKRLRRRKIELDQLEWE